MKLFWFITLCMAYVSTYAIAADYKIDETHTFIEFRIKHLGYSWLYGRFNTMSGDFSYDANNPESSTLMIKIDPASIDTNHAERDKHLREADFLHVGKYPDASFHSTEYEGDAENGIMKGELTLHGVTRSIEIEVNKLGEGADPWGGYRAGFIGTTTLTLEDFGIDYNLGPASKTVELELGVEGIRE